MSVLAELNRTEPHSRRCDPVYLPQVRGPLSPRGLPQRSAATAAGGEGKSRNFRLERQQPFKGPPFWLGTPRSPLRLGIPVAVRPRRLLVRRVCLAHVRRRHAQGAPSARAGRDIFRGCCRRCCESQRGERERERAARGADGARGDARTGSTVWLFGGACVQVYVNVYRRLRIRFLFQAPSVRRLTRSAPEVQPYIYTT